MLDIFSNWNLVRVSGFLAYFLLTLSIIAGILQKYPSLKKQKPLMMELHKTSGWIGVLTVIFHSTLLLFNHYVPYEIEDLFIPFEADHEPLLSAFGTISFYLFLIVMATSDFFMKKLGFKVWKKLHWLVIPAWILTVLHSFFIGTDSNEPWAIFIYFLGVISVGISLIFRSLGQIETTKSKKEKVA